MQFRAFVHKTSPPLTFVILPFCIYGDRLASANSYGFFTFGREVEVASRESDGSSERMVLSTCDVEVEAFGNQVSAFFVEVMDVDVMAMNTSETRSWQLWRFLGSRVRVCRDRSPFR